MTFNENARVERSRVNRRRGGAGVAVGGGAVLVLFLLSQLLGVDLTSLAPSGDENPGQVQTQEGACTGADANADVNCRMTLAYEAVDQYWSTEFPAMGGQYITPAMTTFSGGISTACGQASSAIGPFYCPADQGIYLDTDFFSLLRTQLGAEGGPLAEMYIVAHEWGHHIQNLAGTMDRIDRSASGPTSDAVRLELQADCFAGAWAGDATQSTDASGVPFLQPFTDAELATALDAAESVGDDHIQESQTGQIHPDSWTHGSSEQRQAWFTIGYERGASACDTFGVGGDQL